MNDVVIESADVKHGLIAEQTEPDSNGQRVGNHQRNKRPRLKLEQQKFDRQERARDRSVEHRRQARSRATSQQDFPLGSGGRNDLADQRTERSAGLNDGTFGAERTSRTNADRSRNGLENCHFGFDPALGSEHCLHRLREFRGP